MTDLNGNTQLLIVVTTTTVAGLGLWMIVTLGRLIHRLASSVFLKLTFDRGSSPPSLPSISGASRISGITFVLKLEEPGSGSSVAFAIRPSTRISVYGVLGAAILLHLTCQVRQIASRPRQSKPSSG